MGVTTSQQGDANLQVFRRGNTTKEEEPSAEETVAVAEQATVESASTE